MFHKLSQSIHPIPTTIFFVCDIMYLQACWLVLCINQKSQTPTGETKERQ
jgi:hypothetical protein